MTVEVIKKPTAQSQESNNRGTRFPTYDLTSCIEVPRALYTKGGGKAAPDAMASYLGYKGTNNGAYLSKIGAARLFGLIEKAGHNFVPTNLAHQILSPVYPYEAKKALVDAFMNVELFKKVYDDFLGRELPPAIGMQNALRTQYGIAPNRVEDAYESLMSSAETAGFFETKAGKKTHLIKPNIQSSPPAGEPPATNPQNSTSDSGLEDKLTTPIIPPANAGLPSANMGDVKAKYLAALIKLFEEKCAKGDLDESLMQRIERLLGESGGKI